MKARTYKLISFPVIAFILALVLALSITCGVMSKTLDRFLVKDKVIVTEQELTAQREAGEKLADEIEGEGIVMTKNDGEALPLDKSADKKVNVFGWSSTQWIAGGSGSGRVVNGKQGFTAETGLLEALSGYGIEYNTAVTDMYKSYLDERPFFKTGTLESYNYQFSRLYEPDIDDAAYYTRTMLDDAVLFSDIAIVVIGRVSGESNDSPTVQYKGKINTSGAKEDKTRHYLEISAEEEKLLSYCGRTFGKVIVVVNSVSTMELGFLDTIEGLDACLLAGGTGINAATAIPKVLYGEVTPSGKTTDTYAYEFKSSAAFVNSGENGTTFYTNGAGLYPADGTTNGNVPGDPRYDGVSYLDYAESIYVGYKWYETADAEGYFNAVDNKYGKGYSGVVQYPFGYGLSYTDFSREIVSLSPAAGSALDKDGEISVTVQVTNTGTVKGKDVVELYYTPRYIEGGIEKAAVNLAAFAKTQELAPGDSQQLILSFSVSDMASYDCYDKNGNGFKGYELDEGKYEVKLMNDAHEPASVKVSGNSAHSGPIIEYNVAGNIRYDKDPVSGKDVSNKFTGREAKDGVALDGSDSGANITYLSRADFAGTLPKAKTAPRAMTQNVIERNLYTPAMADAWKDDSAPAVTMGADNGMMVADSNGINALGLQLGGDFDDPAWEKVLDQLTEKEMRELVLHGYVQTQKLASIGKPSTKDADGPAQIGSFNMGDKHGVGYPNPTVLAQSWNQSLAYSFGKSIGIEAGQNGYDGWYAPAVNIHRSPFGGRNYEYYSEDAYLSGVMSANTIKAVKNTGVYVYLKHIAIYEQETARDALYVWLTEQAMREIYLKPFKIAIDAGGATGLMSAYGRVGAVWAGGSTAMIQGVVRDEWNFNGAIITDYADHKQFMNIDQALRAGADLWMDGWLSDGKFTCETSSNSFKQALRNSSKRIVYMWLNAAYTNQQYNLNGDDDEKILKSKTEPGFRWWVLVLVIADVIGVGGAALWTVLALKKKDKPVSGGDSKTLQE